MAPDPTLEADYEVKARQRDNYLRDLDAQVNERNRRRQDEKRRNLEEELRLEEKLKKDLEEIAR